MKTICKHNENSLLFETGNSESLVEAIEYAVNNPEKMVEMGLNGLRFAKTKTHQNMHENREAFFFGSIWRDVRSDFFERPN